MRLLPAIAMCLLAAARLEAGSLQQPMVEFALHGQRVEGSAMAFDSSQVLLLARDGRLWRFAPQEARDYRSSAERFSSLSVAEFRAALLRELGPKVDVSGTGHYLVVHPRGERDRWAQRFEDLYRSAVMYFSVRGFRPEEPPFPLIGIVCRDQDEFRRYAASQGTPVGNGILGFYSWDSNRIVLYDATGGKSDDKSWQPNASTLIHEATHQTAFNIGVHSRLVPPPRWVAEGLAMLFEAPGVYDSGRHRTQRERLNLGRLKQFREGLLPQHRPELLAGLIASDELFFKSAAAAYAESWAFTFYLTETQPQKYFDYLGRTARRPPLSTYTAAERTADFTDVFGHEMAMTEAQFVRYLRNLTPEP